MLHSSVIEVRQHLCCANVFLKFKQSLTDLEALRIIVDETKVKLQNPKHSAEIVVNKFFSILPGSFSSLVVDADNASFRVSVGDIKLPQLCEHLKRDVLQLNLAEQEDVSIICTNCSSILITQQKYDKIREFPSGAIDADEFFCHHGPNFKDVLVPLETDLFYGFQFIIINRTLIEKSTREKENHIYCRRCLRYFGETMLNGKAAKLWCDSIRFSSNGNILEIFSSDNKSHIYKLMLKAIEETSLPSPELLLRNIHFTKVLLTAFLPNRQQQYLLLHILEKNLPVLRNENDSVEEHENARIEFKQEDAFKILYRLIAEDSNDKKTSSGPAILEYWQQDINILKIKTSPSLFSTLIKELNKNTEVFPEIYRVNNDEFLLSYIFY